MSPDQLLTDMRAALDAERDAIRRLDAAAVIQASETKERILEALRTAPPAERPALASALGELKLELRRNLLLLAHARDYLREALELFGRGRLDARL